MRVAASLGFEPRQRDPESLVLPLHHEANFYGRNDSRPKILLHLSRSFSTVNGMKAKTWEKTRLQNLVRHRSGRYYARAFAGGKEIWKSLKTSHFSVAQARLAEFLKEHRKRRSNGEVSAKMTFGEAAAIHLQNLNDNLSIKPRTRDYWRQRLDALVRSWP